MNSNSNLPIGTLIAQVTDGFAVYTTVNEYGQTGNLQGVFTNEAQADKVNATAGWYGGKGKKRPVQILYFDGVQQYYVIERGQYVAVDQTIRDVNEERREAALAKLTDEDKRVLGIV